MWTLAGLLAASTNLVTDGETTHYQHVGATTPTKTINSDVIQFSPQQSVVAHAQSNSSAISDRLLTLRKTIHREILRHSRVISL